MKKGWLIVIVFIFFKCDFEENISIEKDEIDELSILENYNTEKRILKGTKTFNTHTALYSKMEYQFNPTIKNYDTSFYTLNKTTLSFYSNFQSVGNCGNFYSWLKRSNDTLFLNVFEVNTGGVKIENNDTIITMQGCPMESYREFIISIPVDSMINTSVIIYNNPIANHKINFYLDSLQLKTNDNN